MSASALARTRAKALYTARATRTAIAPFTGSSGPHQESVPRARSTWSVPFAPDVGCLPIPMPTTPWTVRLNISGPAGSFGMPAAALSACWAVSRLLS